MRGRLYVLRYSVHIPYTLEAIRCTWDVERYALFAFLVIGRKVLKGSQKLIQSSKIDENREIASYIHQFSARLGHPNSGLLGTGRVAKNWNIHQILKKMVRKWDTFIKFRNFRPIFIFLGFFGHVFYDFESKLIFISFFNLLKSTFGSPQGPSGDNFWTYFGCFFWCRFTDPF